MVKPRLAIFIGQSDALTNLLNIGLGMKVVRIGKLPAKLRSEQFPYSGFPGAHDPHDDYNHGAATSSGTSFDFRCACS